SDCGRGDTSTLVWRRRSGTMVRMAGDEAREEDIRRCCALAKRPDLAAGFITPWRAAGRWRGCHWFGDSSSSSAPPTAFRAEHAAQHMPSPWRKLREGRACAVGRPLDHVEPATPHAVDPLPGPARVVRQLRALPIPGIHDVAELRGRA